MRVAAFLGIALALGSSDATVSLAAARPSLPLYDISRSGTSTLHEDHPIRMKTAQYPGDTNMVLEGYMCKDDIQLGGIKSRVSFACWMNSLNPMLWNVMGNGILGLGPGWKEQDSKGELPPPFLHAYGSDLTGDKTIPKKYALMASKAGAELQLGGFVKDSVVGDIHQVQSRHANMYTLGIKSIRIGDSYDTSQELMSFSPKAKQNFVPALIDTMQPCIMLPDNLEKGNLASSPYELYQNRGAPWKSMYITVEGIDEGLEIPYNNLLVEHHTFLDEAWGTSIRPCVLPVSTSSKSEFTPVVLGTILFRSYSVLFDLSKSTVKVPPTIGFSRVNPSYDIIGVSDWRATLQGTDDNPVHRLYVQHGATKIKHVKSEASPAGGEEVGVYDSTGHQFIVQLLAGTPAQPVHVVLDSGSPITGFFVDSVSLKRFEHGERPDEKGRDLPFPHRHRAQAACLFKLSSMPGIPPPHPTPRIFYVAGVSSLAHRRPEPLTPSSSKGTDTCMTFMHVYLLGVGAGISTHTRASAHGNLLL